MTELPENIRFLHDYWTGLASGEAPERVMICLDRLKPILGYLLLIEFHENPFRVRYRLTGTTIDRMTGMNITGRFLDEFATGRFVEPIRYIENCYRRVRETGRHFIGPYQWPVEGNLFLKITMGLFPIRIDGAIRQCLSIEHSGEYEIDQRPIDWRPALAEAMIAKTAS